VSVRVIITSRHFFPHIGGGETNAELLAREFVAAGLEVRVITQTPGDNTDAAGKPFPFPVIRRPSVPALFRQYAWCQIVLQNGLSLRYAWPLSILRRPMVVRHLTWIKQPDQPMSWNSRLKMFVLRFAKSISISRAIADHLPTDSQVIGNPYRWQLFRLVNGVARERDLVYLGRLVSDKGTDVLLRAICELRKSGIRSTATIIGTGPEQGTLQNLARELGIEDAVTFAGQIVGEPLVELLNAHQILVVPSLWEEPFGVVALEGAACGCVVVGSDGGGLPDAIGPCGVTFPRGDHQGLSAVLAELLQNPGRLESYRAAAPAHLARHRADFVASEYISFLQKSLRIA
jgi:glycosyltransferase involved in cell wall biosynthesis